MPYYSFAMKPKNVLQLFRGVFSRIFKTLTTFVPLKDGINKILFRILINYN